jgi:hypothetical protein
LNFDLDRDLNLHGTFDGRVQGADQVQVAVKGGDHVQVAVKVQVKAQVQVDV